MTIRKTLHLLNKQDEWIKAQIANEDYTHDSEYFRDLRRRDQEQDGNFACSSKPFRKGWTAA